MADHPRRARNRPDGRTTWDESDRRNRHGGNARDRRDDRDRYRDERPRSRDRRQRSRSRSPINEPRERHRSRSRSRDRRDRARRRGQDNTRGNADGRHFERERDPERDKDRERDRVRDGRYRDDAREENVIPKVQARRGDLRRSASPPRSPMKNLGRAKHDEHSPLPTRSKNIDKSLGRSSARADLDNDNLSRRSNLSANRSARDSSEDDDKRGKKPNGERDASVDAMDEDDDPVAEDDEMSAMQAMMGFGGFASTKGQKVPGNNSGGVYKAKKTEYRQYMNRVGGFNRPLSPGR
ncbi:hypothetical protein GGR50DRAFT_301865 [Xylaria sp. CBS 124048]|nr:hypothetical protein GGR50DRAFT_301865 [Xylaria sp. CBS 124048]